MLEMQADIRARSRAWAKTGKRIAARMAIIAITTSSSISVKARLRVRGISSLLWQKSRSVLLSHYELVVVLITGRLLVLFCVGPGRHDLVAACYGLDVAVGWVRVRVVQLPVVLVDRVESGQPLF